jgi:hypothetical protein
MLSGIQASFGVVEFLKKAITEATALHDFLRTTGKGKAIFGTAVTLTTVPSVAATLTSKKLMRDLSTSESDKLHSSSSEKDIICTPLACYILEMKVKHPKFDMTIQDIVIEKQRFTNLLRNLSVALSIVSTYFESHLSYWLDGGKDDAGDEEYKVFHELFGKLSDLSELLVCSHEDQTRYQNFIFYVQ